ncbi:BCAM0308 family protein [Hyphomicrobium sp. 99]|uniref:BCAM0308 family protein n=1 Tax=Hyphomicrobium sp. 99 TaxID=1163419 RepID=UPI0018CFBABC|nr:BCAM0308 family protein [Hyphomicrobium sp. 99]
MKDRDVHRAERRHDSIKSHHIEEHRHDPYKARHKLTEPAVCPQCGAVFQNGRWQWVERVAEGACEELCPACHRTNDKFPAGEITIAGSFSKAHQTEILALIRNTQEMQNTEHPLSRIIDITETPDKTVVTTTDIHLPRRIGHALESAFKGELDTHYNDEEYFIRMHWKRDT